MIIKGIPLLKWLSIGTIFIKHKNETNFSKTNILKQKILSEIKNVKNL
jgi:hypothetical protein